MTQLYSQHLPSDENPPPFPEIWNILWSTTSHDMGHMFKKKNEYDTDDIHN